MQVDKPIRGYAFVLTAVSLWATLGVFYTRLIDFGFTRLNVALIRSATVALLLIFALTLRGRLRSAIASLRPHALLILAFGAIGIAAFYVLQVLAVETAGVAVSWVLLYTAPLWVVLFSAVFLRERLTPKTIAALALVLVGCALVAKVYAGVEIKLPGVLASLASGLAYAAYILLNKAAERRGLDTWAFLMAGLAADALLLLPLQSFDTFGPAVQQPGAPIWIALLCLGPTLSSAACFMTGLRTIPASTASIVAALEPVFATILALILLHEHIEPWQAVGGILVVSAVTLSTR